MNWSKGRIVVDEDTGMTSNSRVPVIAWSVHDSHLFARDQINEAPNTRPRHLRDLGYGLAMDCDRELDPFSSESLWRLSRFSLEALQPLETLPWNTELPGT